MSWYKISSGMDGGMKNNPTAQINKVFGLKFPQGKRVQSLKTFQQGQQRWGH